MRVAALFDVHGNAPALEAVLAELDGLDVDTILVGGDAASGPMPAETLDLLDTRPETVRFVRGNADRVLDGVRVVNAGSVGYPYEAEPAAYWLLLGPGLEHRRTDYDVASAAERILASGYPSRERYAAELTQRDPERPERLSRLIEFGPDL